jgi:hypothetical protein
MGWFLEVGALVLATAFASAAIYVSTVEHVARMRLPIAAALTQWQPAYKRGAVMQAGLAALGSLAAFGAGYLSGDWRWWFSGAVLLANWPYTLMVIKPVNDRLLETAPESADETTRALLQRWGSLHATRTLLGSVAALIMIWTVLT